MGEKGDDFPKQCAQNNAFRISYDKGRKTFLTSVLKDKQTALKFERQNYERLRDDLQDAQFELGRLPKYRNDQQTVLERNRINESIRSLQNRRNRQRDAVEALEAQIVDIEQEVQSL